MLSDLISIYALGIFAQASVCFLGILYCDYIHENVLRGASKQSELKRLADKLSVSLKSGLKKSVIWPVSLSLLLIKRLPKNDEADK